MYAGEVSEIPLSRFLISVPAAGVKVKGEAAVKKALSEAFKDMEPPGAKQDVQATASMLTAEILHRHEEETRAAVTGTAAAAAEAPSADYISDALRPYLGKVCVTAAINPPMPLTEIQRRIDLVIREGHPELANMPYRIEAGQAAAKSGELKSFDMWARDDYNGIRVDTPNPKFWCDIVTAALKREAAFASSNTVEPTMAREAWDKAVIAILISLAAMTVYIWFRFAKFSSGIAAVVATLHDVLVTLGAVTAASLVVAVWGSNFLMLTDMKVNLPLIGAFLTLVGYSVNDTIVVFDRIRENRGKYGDLSPQIINNSINQTLSRTVLTSSTVFLAVVALYFFGGETSSIHGLAFVMLIGTIIGCYSSIAIASPILVMTDYMKRVYAWFYPIIGAGVLVYFLAVWRVTATAMDYWLGAGGAFAAQFPSADPTKPFTASLAHYVSAAPSAIFGSWVGWAVVILAVVWIVWVIVAAWGVFSISHNRPWTLLIRAPGLVKVLAAVSLLAPVLAVILFAVSVVAKGGIPAWAGPECAAAMATCPATYMFYRLFWGEKVDQKN